LLKKNIPLTRFVFLVVFLLPLCLKAQTYNYVHYDEKDGLAGSTVYDACQDKDGFIWFATENGLSRYDGTNFKNFTVKDGLPDNEVLKLLADSKGRVWISTFSKEVCFYYRGKIFNRDNDSLVKHLEFKGALFCMVEDRDGNILLTDEHRLIEITSGNEIRDFSEYPKIKNAGPPYSGFANNYDGGFFIVTKDTVFKYNNDSFKFSYLVPHDSMTRKYMEVKLFSDGRRISKSAPAEVTTTTNGWLNNIKFANTIEGVWEIDSVNYSLKEHFLPGKKVTRTFEDAEKNLWFATLGEGVYRLPSRNTFTYIFPKQKASNNTEVYTISKYGGSLVGGLNYSTAVVVKDRQLAEVLDYNKISMSIVAQTELNRMYSTLVTSSGILMLGFNVFLGKLENNNFSFLPMTPLKSLAEIDRDRIMVGTAKGVFILRVKDFKITDTLWSERSTKVFYNADKYYIGTLKGLYEINLDKSSKYLGELHPALKRRITDIKRSADNSLWIATSDAGLVNYKNGKVAHVIKDSNGLSSNICKALFVQHNFLWVGTNKGINKIVLAGNDLQITKYSSSDGLPSDIINDLYVEDSIVWVASPAGLTYFNQNMISNSSMCNLRLLNVSIADQNMEIDSNYKFSYKNNKIRFEYIGISARSVGDIVYHYRLKGLSDKWKETRQTILDYPSLPSGDYTLELYAVNKFNVKSNIINIRFSITTPFWKSWIFYVGLLLLIVVFTSWVVNRRNKKVALRIEEKNTIQQRFAGLEQQALQAQMNPHFIFNCLNSIQQYILTNDKEKANEYLTGFASLIRQTLDNSGKKSITVAEEVRYLTSYLEMENMRFGDDFVYNIEIEPSVKPDFIEIPALLLQPYVENSLRHGLRNKPSGLRKLAVLFSMTQTGLRCRIKDNGVGRKKAEELKSRQHIEYQSKGMDLTEQRIGLLNKINQNLITVQIIDLVNTAGDPEGTEVIVDIPVSS